MRIIDADSLMDDIKRDSKKAIDEGDKVGSFWLGYAAGLVIKQPTIQPEKAQLSKEGTTSDLISRTETVKQLQGVFDVTVPITDYDGGFVDGVEVGVSTVSTMPPAQPEPKEGRFERKQDGVFCSVCHYGWEFITGVPAEVEREYHYCPNCGADMRGEKDG